MRTRRGIGLVVLVALMSIGCGGSSGDTTGSEETANFTVATEVVEPLAIVSVDDEEMRKFFAKRVNVFGVDIVASAATPDDKVLHAANVMAQYFDNDEDGALDNPALVDKMIENKALLIMFADFEELEQSGLRGSDLSDRYRMQDCEGHETNPAEGFDASIEEVLHLISDTGYGELYPEAFSTDPGTRLTDAMDLARGGQFDEVPPEYPPGAWYTYTDETCHYDCMAGEYFYWALSTILGAQADSQRCEWISNEWRPCTAEAVAEMDPAVYALMTDPQYRMPTVLPDGSYGR